MPKMKSHSGTKKRVRRTGGGKYAVKRRGRSHLLLQKKKRQKRINRTLVPSTVDKRKFQTLVPYL